MKKLIFALFLRQRKFGFTLVELMVVVSIIGILASIAIPKFADLLRKAEEGATKGSLGNIRSSMSIYYSENEGVFAASLRALTVNGKYLNRFPKLQLPYYHDDLITPGLLLDDMSSGCGVIPRDLIQDSLSFSESHVPGQPPAWTYNYVNPNCYDNVDMTNVGHIWISCSHTDTKGSSWSNY